MKSHSNRRSSWLRTSFLPPLRNTPFVPSLAGEIHEFKQDLNSLDRGKKKDAVKKVIAGKHLVSFIRSQILISKVAIFCAQPSSYF